MSPTTFSRGDRELSGLELFLLSRDARSNFRVTIGYAPREPERKWVLAVSCPARGRRRDVDGPWRRRGTAADATWIVRGDVAD